MYSLSFPNMFSINKTNLVEDREATLSNMILLLLSDKTSLFGDPYYGTILKRLIYQQNDNILRDIIIDEIYTCIITFMPQIRIQRKDIALKIKGKTLSANIKCTNVIDNEDQDFTILLLSGE